MSPTGPQQHATLIAAASRAAVPDQSPMPLTPAGPIDAARARAGSPATRPSNTWQSATRSRQCPVCGKTKCSFSKDGVVLVCWRGNGGAGVTDDQGVLWRYKGPTQTQGVIYVVDGHGDGIRARTERQAERRLTGSAAWTSRADRYYNDQHADHRRNQLAAHLGVSLRSLEGLSVGWKNPTPAYVEGAWTYPQRSASAAVVSVGLRLVKPIDGPRDRQRYDTDGTTSSTHGLIFIPGRWLTHDGPVYSVEGMTDTAALDSLKFDVVGHPGNSPKGKLLFELVALLRRVPSDRWIVIVAERDGDPNDNNSPGRRGASDKARALAQHLDRDVGVILPPDGLKDSREWTRHRVAGDWSAATVAMVRQEWIDWTTSAITWVSPEPASEAPCRVEVLPEPKPKIPLDDYRHQMRDSIRNWARAPRTNQGGEWIGKLALIAAPAGTGKTQAVDDLALDCYDAVVAAVPTHDNVAERRTAILESIQRTNASIRPDDVVAYPKLDERSCRSFTDEQAADLRAQGHSKATSAQRATELGFAAQATACRGCPLSPWSKRATHDAAFAAFADDTVASQPDACAYWQAMDAAKTARVQLSTHERVRRSAKTLTRGPKKQRRLLVIDEDVAATLFPTAEVPRSHLVTIADALEGAALRLEDQDNQRRRRRRRSDNPERTQKQEQQDQDANDTIVYVRRLAAVAASVVDRLDRLTSDRTFGVTVTEKPLDVQGEAEPTTPIKRAQSRLADVVLRSLPDDAIVDGKALEAVKRLHSGDFDQAALCVHQLDGGSRSRLPEEDRRVAAAVVVTWTTAIHRATDVLLIDGTVDAETLERRIGRPIQRLDPPNVTVGRQQPAIHLPADITNSTSPAKVGRALEQALLAMPSANATGVILLPTHRDALFPRDDQGNDVRPSTSRDFVPDDVLARIAVDNNGRLLVEHYRGGRDRSSNEWLHHCDALVLLGTPRPNVIAIVSQLLRGGHTAEAEAGSEWGQVQWQALNAAGERLRCFGNGYLDPTWAQAANSVTRAAMTQALERARTVLESGIPVVVVSNEPTGLPVIEALPDPVTAGARRVVDAIRKIAGAGKRTRAGNTTSPPDWVGPNPATTPIEEELSSIEVLAGSAQVLAELMKVTGPSQKRTSERTARRWVQQSTEVGLVRTIGAGPATRYAIVATAATRSPSREPPARLPAIETGPREVTRPVVTRDPVTLAIAATGPSYVLPSNGAPRSSPVLVPMALPIDYAGGPTGPALTAAVDRLRESLRADKWQRGVDDLEREEAAADAAGVESLVRLFATGAVGMPPPPIYAPTGAGV